MTSQISNPFSSLECELVGADTQPRCYRTRDIKIDRVCHHCGLPMSKQVGMYTKPAGLLYIFLENFEFTGLNLKKISTEEEGIHCHKCMHFYFSFSWVLVLMCCCALCGLLIFLTYKDFLIESVSNIVIYQFILYFIAGIIFIWSLLTIVLIISNRLKAIPFPIIGRNLSLEIIEKISGEIFLHSDNLYTEDIAARQGHFDFSVNLTPEDYERFLKYRSKFKFALNDDYLYHAGFLLFKSTAAIYFDSSLSLMPRCVNTLVLTKSSAEQHLFVSQRDNWHWQASFPFTAEHSFDQQELLPLQIVPTIVSEGEQMTALELTIQIHPDIYADSLDISNPQVIDLKLTGPNELVAVRSAFPPHVSRNNQPSVHWQQVDLDQGDKNARFGIFYVRFDFPVEAGMIFHGKLHARFDGSYSGIKNILTFYPLGHNRIKDDIYIKQYTDVIIDFKLNLQQILFRRQLTLESPYPLVKKGLIPNHLTINNLIGALSSNGYYVQRVIENPPRTNRGHANVINRFWDIAGRLYKRLYPIDFHLVVRGKEHYEEGYDQPTPDRSETVFDLTVQATVTDLDLQEQVEYVEEQLKAVIQSL